MGDNKELIKQCEERAQQWLTPAFDEETRKAVKEMLDNEDKTELIECRRCLMQRISLRLSMHSIRISNLVLVVCVALWVLVQTA